VHGTGTPSDPQQRSGTSVKRRTPPRCAFYGPGTDAALQQTQIREGRRVKPSLDGNGVGTATGRAPGCSPSAHEAGEPARAPGSSAGSASTEAVSEPTDRHFPGRQQEIQASSAFCCPTTPAAPQVRGGLLDTLPPSPRPPPALTGDTLTCAGHVQPCTGPWCCTSALAPLLRPPDHRERDAAPSTHSQPPGWGELRAQPGLTRETARAGTAGARGGSAPGAPSHHGDLPLPSAWMEPRLLKSGFLNKVTLAHPDSEPKSCLWSFCTKSDLCPLATLTEGEFTTKSCSSSFFALSSGNSDAYGSTTTDHLLICKESIELVHPSTHTHTVYRTRAARRACLLHPQSQTAAAAHAVRSCQGKNTPVIRGE